MTPTPKVRGGHVQKAMYQEALQEVEKGLALSHRDPFFLAVAAVVHRRLGQMNQAAKLVEEMRAESKLTSLRSLLQGWASRNRRLTRWNKPTKLTMLTWVALPSDPLLSPLHSNHRFQDLVRRMNFPTITGRQQQ